MSKQLKKEQFIALIEAETDIILPLGNGEPVKLFDWLEEEYESLVDVKVHQMLSFRKRDYLWGKMRGHLTHISYFLSGTTRKPYYEGYVELVPNTFSEMPKILRTRTKKPFVLATVSPMDAHGYFSFGTQADYIADLIGEVPFVVEVNRHMPRTFGQNQIHISQVEGYIEHDTPLIEEVKPTIEEDDLRIASYITADIQDGDTLQVGIGAIPDAVMRTLKQHRHLGIHTEMLTESVVDLVEAGAVDGTRKVTNPGKIATTFIHGTERLFKFVHDNPVIQMFPVNIINDPREIAKEPHMVSINSTTEIDLYGQCASETVGGRYYSSSGGQADFARGVRAAKYGKGYICLPSTAKGGEVSRIQVHLTPGSVVTTSKNEVDNVVTEYGIARLYGKSLSERARALIAIAHPKFREELTFEAKKKGILI